MNLILRELDLELEDGVEALTDAAVQARSRDDTGLANDLEILTADQSRRELGRGA